jgi:transposase
MSNIFSPRPCARAISSSWIIYQPIKSPAERAGARLRYLPPYSPDLNPIEQAFAKLKAASRKAAARTLDALIKAIAQALAEFASQECAKYIPNVGYRHVS